MASFRAVFIAVVAATALILGALLINSRRPAIERAQPRPELVRATGKCASCHREETAAIVHEYELSRHAAAGITCLDCHGAADGQEKLEHRGFVLARTVTSLNCSSCHAREYREYVRSRHAAPAYAAILGDSAFTPEQIQLAEAHNPGAVKRPPNALAALEGGVALRAGCVSCHSIGRPNADGSIGSCTACHGRHQASVALARLPETCGQCHMGPDHSQLEIYTESKHGVLFNLLRPQMNLSAPAGRLTAEDMPVPTCATCHMSGLGGTGSTHDVGQRLSWYLFAEVSTKRPNYLRGREAMMAVCDQCHTEPHTRRFFAQAEQVLVSVNARVREAQGVMSSLRGAGLLGAPYSRPIDFDYFDYWHYAGRTAKHGAFMGGADFVQWHGNYELTRGLVELRAEAAALRAGHGAERAGAGR